MIGKQLWKQPAPAGPGTKSAAVMEVTPEETAKSAAVMEPPALAEETAAESHLQLVERGWCTWRCEGLDGDTIVIVIDDTITGMPLGYPVYTLQELKDILGLDDQLLQVAHRAKRELGAQIEGSGEKENST